MLSETEGGAHPPDFVEFRALASLHGIAVQSLANDVTIELAADGVAIAGPAS